MYVCWYMSICSVIINNVRCLIYLQVPKINNTIPYVKDLFYKGIGHPCVWPAKGYKPTDRVISEHFNSKCVHLYGCEAWDQLDPCVDNFYTSWNKSVRRLYDLPFTTHQIFIGICKQATCKVIGF